MGDNHETIRIANEQAEMIIRKLVYHGYKDLDSITKAYVRNMHDGLNLLEGVEKYKEPITKRVCEGYNLGKVLKEIEPVRLNEHPRCPMLMQAYIAKHGKLPGRFEYDLWTSMMCTKKLCEWWNDKKQKCSQAVTTTGGPSRKTIMEAVEKLQKPKDYLVHPQCMNCANWNSEQCKDCPTVPKNYVER